jgi:hypothetical protein
MSMKPAPGVGTVRSEDTMVVALTVDGAEREIDFVMNGLSTPSSRPPSRDP